MNIAIFGYGSLANKLDVERTLQRPVDELAPAVVMGWARKWNVSVRNPADTTPRFELLDGKNTVPNYVMALNIYRFTRERRSVVNGALFALSEAELQGMDYREAHYDRVDITDEIITTTSFDKIYAYTGKPEHTSQKPADAIIPNSYVLEVERGFAELGAEWLSLFHETTMPPEHEIVDAEYIRA